MMGRQDKQLQMVIVDLSSMVPQNHLLRIIKENICFDFIYDKVADRYSFTGRPSIESSPKCWCKFLYHNVYCYAACFSNTSAEVLEKCSRVP